MELSMELLTLLKKADDSFECALSSCGLKKLAYPDNPSVTTTKEENDIRGDSKGYTSQAIEAITSALGSHPMDEETRSHLKQLKQNGQIVANALHSRNYLDAYEGLKIVRGMGNRFREERVGE